MARDALDFGGLGPLPDPWESLSVELRGVLSDRGAASRDVALRRLAFRSWVDLVPEERGPLDFGRFAYQRELYDESMAEDREVVFAKATQVGVSTLAVRWALFHADVHGRVCLYTFPTDRELGDFSRQRIRPVVRASEHLRSRIPSDAVDNVGLRQVGAGWVFFRGTNKPIDSIAADCVVFDEYDSSVQENIEASERRITGPMSAGLLRRVGVPSYPGFGISAAYEESDQRVWSVKCGACGEWNPLRGWEAFVSNVDQEACELVCRKCRRRLDVQSGEWVATFPDRDVRGYHLPKLIVPGVRLRELVTNARKTRPDQRQAFYNRDLGEPYAPAEGRLSIDQLRGCVRDDLRPLPALRSDKPVTMGVDVASVRALNVVIEEIVDDRTGRRVFVGEIEDGPDGSAFEQLCDLMHRYGVSMAAIDHAPEGRFASAFAERFPGRVYRVGYFVPQPGHRRDVMPWNVDDAARFVSLSRTLAIDATLERFRLGAILLPPLEMLPPNYPAHMGALVRRNVELPNGQVRSEYVKTGADDWAHAEVYCLAAVELFWRRLGLDRVRDLAADPVPLLDIGGAESDPYETVPIYEPGFD
jgi:hypothetical protein